MNKTEWTKRIKKIIAELKKDINNPVYGNNAKNAIKDLKLQLKNLN